MRALLGGILLAIGLPGMALAHAAERMVILTLPTTFAIWGAGIVVALTALIGVFLSQLRFRDIRLFVRPALNLTPVTSWIACLGLLALIAWGFWGTHDPLRNPLVIAVWIGIWIALPLLTMIFGDLWPALSPWSEPVRACREVFGIRGRIGLARFGHWPAVIGLFGFAWFEIVSLAPADPNGLARVVLLYWTAIYIVAVLEGEDWLERGEMFTVYFGFLARIAPLWSNAHPQGRSVHLGWPGTRILHMPPLSTSQIAFVTLVLAAVSFDGLSETFWWLARLGVNPLEFPGRSAVVSQNTIGLIIAWALVTASLLGVLYLTSPHMPDRAQHIRKQMTAFLPISGGYHAAHYLVSLLTTGQYAIVFIDDPFRRGWHLLNLPQNWVSFSFLSDFDKVRLIFGAQIALIVGVHVIAIFLSRAIDTRSNASPSAVYHVAISLLMVLYTIFGLWLLSSPTGA